MLLIYVFIKCFNGFKKWFIKYYIYIKLFLNFIKTTLTILNFFNKMIIILFLFFFIIKN